MQRFCKKERNCKLNMTGECVKMGKKTALQVFEGPLFIYSTRKSEKNEVLQIWLGGKTYTHFRVITC